MPHEYSKEELEKAGEFAKKHPKYHVFLMKHPWLPGLYMVIAGISLVLMWYFKIGQDTSSFSIRKGSKILHFVGIAAFSWGIYHIVRYIKNPEKIHKEFRDWEKQI